ncbi:MAG: RagB/SusD family nutrient uptake outer membrane protein [Candidatus Pseudobacter hemicellulosilyticus]|uniref:RagB/SusD family nutrient uptake outer membrane protein n=1 Tax=Candidatus Pseudobacter hemicellulosilyticus TaxID=3121375 RepID=A0AAJ5WQP2_9BACT|nr:MAG: RagB/SusD family nutrient uptake outer membrane protein [Pseudobacter sp.]
MQKIYKGLFTCLVAATLSGCEKNLEPNLYGEIFPENFYQTPADLKAATTAVYHNLRLGGWGPYMFCDGSSLIMDEVATGEWTVKWSWENFLKGIWNTGDAMAYGFYNWVAPAVTKCTHVIAGIEDSPVDANLKAQYIAEMRALRAFFVYDIYRLYGPMPLITTRELALNPDPDYKPARPTAAEVVSFLEKELREAADVLAVTAPEYGRLTKGASLHYLLKLYMHEKSFEDGLRIANEIIGLNYYQLEPVYADIFSVANERNKEVIFSITAEALANYGNHSYVNILPGDYASPSGNSVDGWNGHRMPWAFYDSFDPADKRRELIIAEYRNKSGSNINLRSSGDIGALPLKYGIDPKAVGIWSGSDKIMDRYTEVLLFKAECLNEIYGPTAESIELINNIRRRAFGAGVIAEPETVLQESFDGSLNGEVFGNLTLKNFDGSGNSEWIYSKDGSGKLTGDNSLQVEVKRSGAEFWTLQIRTGDVPIVTNKNYTISFRAVADKDVSFDFRSEGPLGHTERINLTANQVRDISIPLNAPGGAGNAVMFFALGNTGSNYHLWLDELRLTATLKSTGGGVEDQLLKLSDYTDKSQLRERLLQERAWEFWYEGKRREDLIRMGDYVKEGKKHAQNFTDKNLRFPIPNAVMIENPRLIQNDGY